MSKKTRQVVKIDEELCNGCGLCVPSCAEGALRIIDGKARMISEKFCDGLGACLGECPQGAISIETREAEDFDEQAATAHAQQERPAVDSHASSGHEHKHSGFVCPSARTIDRTREVSQATPSFAGSAASELRQWPVKLYLLNPAAPYFNDADLLLAADCVPFACGAFHSEFLKGKVLLTGCPKFDDTKSYAEKLTEIMQMNDTKSVTVVQMEVPCCSGMLQLARLAVLSSGKDIPLESVTISLSGDVKDRSVA